MRISVIAPIKNEVDFLGYSMMAANPIVDEFVYTVARSSDDGTIDLLFHMKQKLGDKLKFFISDKYDFNPLNQKDYNQAFNDCIDAAKGDVCWFLHPDMVVTNAKNFVELSEGPLAWWTHVTSYAGDVMTQITQGRQTKWKNMHQKKFGLRYFGGYGSHNEDFYHSDITGTAYKHYGTEFEKYPFQVMNSGISVNHYCELKDFNRRLEKMKLCLRTQNPHFSDSYIEGLAKVHPRVTLDAANKTFGNFEFERTHEPVPDVFYRYKSEFEPFKKKVALV